MSIFNDTVSSASGQNGEKTTKFSRILGAVDLLL